MSKALKWEKKLPEVFFDEEDVSFLKLAVHRQAEQLIRKAKELDGRLDRICMLASPLSGYWLRVDREEGESHVMCTRCGHDITGFEWATENGSKMAGYVRFNNLPFYCSYCGSENSPVLSPSEYFSFLSACEMDENEKKNRMDDFFEKVTAYMGDIDFIIHDYQNEEEALLVYEYCVGEGNYPLFDKKGGVVYG